MFYRARASLALLGLLWVIMALVLSRAAGAAEPPPRPEKVEPLVGMPDCPRALEFTPGQKLELPEWLVDKDGVVQCRAIAEPYTSFADLLLIETSYNELRGLYRADTIELEFYQDHWKGRALAAEARLAEPPPFWDRPSVAAWRGRLEMAAAVAFAAWGLGQLNEME